MSETHTTTMHVDVLNPDGGPPLESFSLRISGAETDVQAAIDSLVAAWESDPAVDSVVKVEV